MSWTGKHGRDKVGTRANLQLRTFVRGVSQFAYINILKRDDVRVWASLVLVALWTELFEFIAFLSYISLNITLPTLPTKGSAGRPHN